MMYGNQGLRTTITGLLTALLLALMLAGCSGAGSNTSESNENIQTASGQGNAGDENAAADQSSDAAADEAEDEEPAEKLDTEALRNDSGKTMLLSFTTDKSGSRHATVAIVSSQGTVVIADPYRIPPGDGRIPADIITVSHDHSDHKDEYYMLKAKEARISKITPETFTVKDVKVTGIAAAHFDGDEITDTAPTNVIYLFEVDGLRIAHFGDFGQEKLTDAQLEALGPIDVAITRFSKETRFGASADKTFNLLDQVKPKLMLPTHYEQDVIDDVLGRLNVTDKVEIDKLLLDAEEVRSLDAPRYIMLN